MFFLNPRNLSVGVFSQVKFHLVVRERRELFKSKNSDILKSEFFSSLEKVVVNLSGAEKDSFDLILRVELIGVSFIVHSVESLAQVEFLNFRGSGLISEELFGVEHDERLSELSAKLSSHGVEIVGRSGALDELEVDFSGLLLETFVGFDVEVEVVITQLAESLDSSGRMFRTHTVHTVGQHEDDSRLLTPLGLSSNDKVVDHDLGSVCKVTELSFPHHQVVRTGN